LPKILQSQGLLNVKYHPHLKVLLSGRTAPEVAKKRQCRRCYNALFDAQMVATANFAEHNDVLFCVTSLRDAL
jgi:hypothetical protein